MDSLDSWYPAYVAETCVYAITALWRKLHGMLSPSHISKDKSDSSNKQAETFYDKKPALLLSESTISMNSNKA
jgi:hypothetical protein